MNFKKSKCPQGGYPRTFKEKYQKIILQNIPNSVLCSNMQKTQGWDQELFQIVGFLKEAP